MMWKQVECPFEKDKKIKNYLLTAPVYTEEGKCFMVTRLCLRIDQFEILTLTNISFKGIGDTEHFR